MATLAPYAHDPDMWDSFECLPKAVRDRINSFVVGLCNEDIKSICELYLEYGETYVLVALDRMEQQVRKGSV